MNRPPKLELLTNNGGVCPESWTAFLGWLVKEKPVVAGTFSGMMLESKEDKYKFLLEAMILEVLDTERLLEIERQTVRELSGKLGEFVKDGAEVKFQKVAEVMSKATGGRYALGIVQPGNVPCAVSSKTQRVFVLPWEKLARLAIAEGIDELDSRLIIQR